MKNVIFLLSFLLSYFGLNSIYCFESDYVILHSADGKKYYSADKGLSYQEMKPNQLFTIILKKANGKELISFDKGRTWTNPESDKHDKIDLWPNPSNNFLNIDNEIFNKMISYEIYDHDFRLIENQFILKSNFTSNIIDISFLDEGIYFLVCKTQDKIYFNKFIKINR